MKKLYIATLVVLLALTGCSKKEQMTNFIPTTAPESDNTVEATPTDAAVTPTPKTVYVGQTTPKYVKLTEYNDVLNIRKEPSTNSDVVGFLVHTEKIDVIKIENGWASFVYNGVISYVNADYLVDEKPDYLEPPTPTPAPENSNKAPAKSGPDI